MHVDGIWWLEDVDDLLGCDGEDYLPDELELEGIFDDIVGAVGKVVTAPVDLVAKVLPKPISKPFKAISTIASPTQMVARAAQGRGSIAGTLGASARGRTRTRTRSTSSSRSSQLKRLMASQQAKARLSSSGARTLTGGRDDLLATMVKMMGAKDIAKIAAGAKPRLAARSSGSGESKSGQQLLVEMVANAVNKKLGPDLTSINKKLALAANQRTATAEHININNELAFRKKVLQDLMRLSTCLPAEHPARVRIRKVGLMSGLL